MSGVAQDKLGRGLAIAGGIVAIAVVVLAIRAMGTPAEQRQQRIDARRMADIDEITRTVRTFAREHDALPATLAVVEQQPGTRLPVDPETNTPYEYAVVDARTFRLCAHFATDTAELDVAPGNAESRHGAGRHCFVRKRKED